MQKQWWSLLLVAAAAAPLAEARAQQAQLEQKRGCKGIEINGPRFSGTQLTLPKSPCPPGSLALREVDLRRGVQVADKGAPVLLLDARLNQGALTITRRGDAAVKGALLWGVATDGTPLRLRVDDMAQGQHLPLYSLTYQSGEGKNPSDKTFVPDRPDWQPLCPSGEKAVMLPGRWDDHQGRKGQGGRTSEEGVMVACQGAALAKCAEHLGYLPWKHRREHESCVRAIRADYCGTGESMTLTGKEINLYDPAGVQKDVADWPLEAEWTEAGARCVERTRVAQNPQDPAESAQAYVKRVCPERLRPCASVKGPAAVLKTEVAPPPKAP